MKDNKNKVITQTSLPSTVSNLATDNEKRQLHLNRERQRRYRQRVLKDPDGPLLTRLQVMISADADGSLSRICEKTGMTKKEAIEKALIDLEARILAERNGTDGVTNETPEGEKEPE
jgi:DNA-binding phage protein